MFKSKKLGRNICSGCGKSRITFNWHYYRQEDLFNHGFNEVGLNVCRKCWINTVKNKQEPIKLEDIYEEDTDEYKEAYPDELEIDLYDTFDIEGKKKQVMIGLEKLRAKNIGSLLTYASGNIISLAHYLDGTYGFFMNLRNHVIFEKEDLFYEEAKNLFMEKVDVILKK